MQGIRADVDGNGAEADDGMGAFGALYGAAMDVHVDTTMTFFATKNAGSHRVARYWNCVSKKNVHTGTADGSLCLRNTNGSLKRGRRRPARSFVLPTMARCISSAGVKRKEGMHVGSPRAWVTSLHGTGTAFDLDDFCREEHSGARVYWRSRSRSKATRVSVIRRSGRMCPLYKCRPAIRLLLRRMPITPLRLVRTVRTRLLRQHRPPHMGCLLQRIILGHHPPQPCAPPQLGYYVGAPPQLLGAPYQ